MNSDKTIFSQLMDFLSPSEFRKCVERYRGNYKVKSFSCWDQFLCMAFAQLTDRVSMIGLIEPPMIAVMEPLRSVPKATSDGSANYEFLPPFRVVFLLFGSCFLCFLEPVLWTDSFYRPARPCIGAMAQTIDGGRPQDAVGEGIRPLRNVEVIGVDHSIIV